MRDREYDHRAHFLSCSDTQPIVILKYPFLPLNALFSKELDSILRDE